MTTRTYTQKDGTIWEWEETKELIAELEKVKNLEKEKENQ